MQKDLQEIKTLLLSSRPAAPLQNVVLDLSNNPSQGEATAKLTLIEFSDFQCPFCGRHARDTAPQIDKEYVSTGKIRHVFLNYPLESMHKAAFKAAEATNCAGEQGKYWEMNHRLFENQNKLEPLTPHAEAIGLDVAKFEACLNSGRQASQIRQNMAEAQKAGVTGTPTFFLAYTDPKSSKVKTVRRMTGAQPYSAFKTEIDKLLGDEPAAPTPKGEQK
jgi:protein-disulfide isomerase